MYQKLSFMMLKYISFDFKKKNIQKTKEHGPILITHLPNACITWMHVLARATSL